jgi:hypothetical protein
MTLKEEIRKGITCNSVGTNDSILSRFICISVHPGKMILFPFLNWFDKRYKHNHRFARLVFLFDLILIGVVMTLGSIAIFLAIWSPTPFSDKIYFDVSVAPREIVVGAPSTLLIRYTNGTDEDLRNVTFDVQFPNHFLLQETTLHGEPVNPDGIIIGDIPVGESGSIRIRGVMFGDVGGEQMFTSRMNFVYGTDRIVAGRKTDTHTFSPVSSTLALTLTLPEQLVAFQPIKGHIYYVNTGEIDFPLISIEPEWPEGFTFHRSNTKLQNQTFNLPALLSGESGEMTFEGFLGDVGEEVTFLFHPSFVFDQTSYKQEMLAHTASVIPPQVTLTQTIHATSWHPGSTTNITLAYENTGDSTVHNVELGVSSTSPFFYQDQYLVDTSTEPELQTLSPGASGEVTLEIPLRPHITRNETSTYKQLSITTKGIANYTLDDGSNQHIETTNAGVSMALTTPVILESFGRYTTPSGDQLGRGPLPPRVGTQTKYWIFWRISGTTNDLESVTLSGTLGQNVEFTERQTVSQDGSATYDANTQTVIWTSDFIESTLDPASKIVAVAFEVGITPTEDMIGTAPTLLSDVRLTAVDRRTGEIITTYGTPITTKLPDDLMASGKEQVQ